MLPAVAAVLLGFAHIVLWDALTHDEELWRSLPVATPQEVAAMPGMTAAPSSLLSTPDVAAIPAGVAMRAVSVPEPEGSGKLFLHVRQSALSAGAEAEPAGDGKDQFTLQKPCPESHLGAFDCIATEESKHLGWLSSSMPPDEVLVVQVDPDSWADKVGLKTGDELMEVQGMDVSSIDQKAFIEFMHKRPLTLSFFRQEGARNKMLQRGSLPATGQGSTPLRPSDVNRLNAKEDVRANFVERQNNTVNSSTPSRASKGAHDDSVILVQADDTRFLAFLAFMAFIAFLAFLAHQAPVGHMGVLGLPVSTTLDPAARMTQLTEVWKHCCEMSRQMDQRITETAKQICLYLAAGI